MRTPTRPHLHVTEKADPGFTGSRTRGQAWTTSRKVAKAPGASAVEDIDEPGGGSASG